MTGGRRKEATGEGEEFRAVFALCLRLDSLVFFFFVCPTRCSLEISSLSLCYVVDSMLVSGWFTAVYIPGTTSYIATSSWRGSGESDGDWLCFFL